MPAKQRGTGKQRGSGRPFVKGDPRAGRPRGRLNNATVEIQALAQALTTQNPAYLAKLKERLESGKAAPVIEQTLLYYAHGKPTERIEHSGLIDTGAMAGLTTDVLRARALAIVRALESE